jgi:hypothetical protein
MLSKTNPLWPSGDTYRHAVAPSDKDIISLHQLALNTFMHVISQVYVVIIIGLHLY